MAGPDDTVEAAPPARETMDLEALQSKDAPVKDPSFQPPEILRDMTPEELEAAETKLRRKIDFRLLPSIIVIYILNYIDR